jgi:hypothetical protein
MKNTADRNEMKLFGDLTRFEAESKLRQIRREEGKLRRLGGRGNYADVQVRMTFDGPGWKRYGVFVRVF